MPSIYKTYTRSSPNKPYRVKTWSDKRCEDCGRYITTKTCKRKLCDNCYVIRHAKQIEESHKIGRDIYYQYGWETLVNLIGPLSRKARNMLRSYM